MLAIMLYTYLGERVRSTAATATAVADEIWIWEEGGGVVRDYEFRRFVGMGKKYKRR